MDQFQTMIKKYGWAAHYVPIDHYHINYHTHGLWENYGHYNFQVTLFMGPKQVHNIISNMVNDVQHGKVFEDGEEYDDYLQDGYKIKIMATHEGGRPVLRVLFPDKQGFMPGDILCNPGMKYQLDEIEENL
jgi:hypothetical protein